MNSTAILSSGLTFLCIIGLGISIYAYYVELQLEQNEKYVAMCDISENMSCTKAFKSEYGKGFGLFKKGSFFYKPNSLVGILFYSVSATLSTSNSIFITKVSYFSWILANILSLYFAYILKFVLYDFCIVCVSIYFINFLSLIFLQLKYNAINSTPTTEVNTKQD